VTDSRGPIGALVKIENPAAPAVTRPKRLLMAKATHSVEDEEEAAEARKYAAEALRALAQIADNPIVEPKLGEEARRSLEVQLVHLKSLAENPDTPDHVKRDIENTLREFRHS
jgi:hypothetical protein